MQGERMRPSAVTHRQLVLFGRRIGILLALVIALLRLAALGLSVSEKVGFWYAFRWSLDSAATVGGFPQPRTTFGQIVQVGLVVLGVGTLFYALATVAELFVAGHLADLLQLRRTQKMIDSLADHHIVCGFGRVGRQVARDRQAAEADFVVIDAHPDNQQLARSLGITFIEGDAADDTVLGEAGIHRARSLLFS